MNSSFGGFEEKGMELLEQGQQAVKQQANTTKQTIISQITGQQQTPQDGHQGAQKLDTVKEQLLGTEKSPTPKLDTVQEQVMGQSAPAAPTEGLKTQILGSLDGSSPVAPTEAQKAQQKAQDDLMQAMYGPSTPEQQASLDPAKLAEKQQEEQKKQQSIKNQLEYVQREIEQPMAQLRQQRVQERQQEEKQEEEEKKMEELQQEEEKKKPVNPTQKTAENKGAGMG